MVMEVLEKNTLADLIDRINRARIANYHILDDDEAENPWAEGRYDRSAFQIGYIPNRILWRLFLCCKPKQTWIVEFIGQLLKESIQWPEVLPEWRTGLQPNQLM